MIKVGDIITLFPVIWEKNVKYITSNSYKIIEIAGDMTTIAYVQYPKVKSYRQSHWIQLHAIPVPKVLILLFFPDE